VATERFRNLIAALRSSHCGGLHEHGGTKVGSAADAAKRCSRSRRFAKELFAVGLLGSSLLAAAILPVTIAYVRRVVRDEKGMGIASAKRRLRSHITILIRQRCGRADSQSPASRSWSEFRT